MMLRNYDVCSIPTIADDDDPATRPKYNFFSLRLLHLLSSARECAPLTARKSAPGRRIDSIRKLPAVCRLWSPDDRCLAFRTGPEAAGNVRRADTCAHTGCPDPSRAVTEYDNNNSNSNNIITILTCV